MKRFACSVFSHTTSIRMPLFVFPACFTCQLLEHARFISNMAIALARASGATIFKLFETLRTIFLLMLFSLSNRITSAPRSEIHSTTRLAGKHLKHLQLCVWRSLIEHIAQRNSRAILQATSTARLAQSVERKALNLVVVGSSPTVGV